MQKIKDPLELKFSHNVIEHLGLRLYQNKPTNVIAELLSNSWDADAENVEILIYQGNEDAAINTIAIMDDGHGMDYETLRTQYLIIGKHKRSKQDMTATSPNKLRKFMGRKGIGKLAPFGIANKITVITRHDDPSGSLVNWFELDLSKLLPSSEQPIGDALEHSYEPIVTAQDCPVNDIPESDSFNPILKSFINMSNRKKSGTLILLQDLKLKRQISIKQLKEGLGRRFTITLLRTDFTIKVDNAVLCEKEALPIFELRIPSSGVTTDTIHIAGKEREIKHWVGFVDITKSEWPQDQAGVGVYAHGKIAQDRPYFFGIKGREIFTRYIYGVIEADWIDEFPEDVVSTDRTTVDWEHTELEELKKFGHNLTNQWINTYKKHSQETRKERLVQKMNSLPDIPNISKGEQQAIINMISGIGPQIDKDEVFQEKIISTITSAWIHRPARQLIKDLWDNIDSSLSNEELIIDTIGKLNDFLVPESLSVAVTVSQRIYALSKLYQLKLTGNENQMQYLIEEFPWILSPNLTQLTANEAMTTMIKKAANDGLIATGRNLSEELKKDGNLKPDFSLLSNANETKIIIVELKSPEIDLNTHHRQQLGCYLDYIEEHYPEADLKGWLVGKNPNNAVKASDTRMDIITWDSLFQQSRKEHLELLAAMLNGAKDYTDDSRLADSIEFGGSETLELLKRMTKVDTDFSALFSKIEETLTKRKSKVK